MIMTMVVGFMKNNDFDGYKSFRNVWMGSQRKLTVINHIANNITQTNNLLRTSRTKEANETGSKDVIIRNKINHDIKGKYYGIRY